MLGESMSDVVCMQVYAVTYEGYAPKLRKRAEGSA
jgi:hypothetical protein